MGLEEFGYLGLFFAGFLAATILPFSSEGVLTILLLNNFDPINTLLIITLGNWLGGVFTYGIGYLGKIDWMKKYFNVSEEKIIITQIKISRYGSFLAFLSWVPIVGDLFTLGLGYFKVNFAITLLFMLLGKFTRYGVIVFFIH